MVFRLTTTPVMLVTIWYGVTLLCLHRNAMQHRDTRVNIRGPMDSDTNTTSVPSPPKGSANTTMRPPGRLALGGGGESLVMALLGDSSPPVAQGDNAFTEVGIDGEVTVLESPPSQTTNHRDAAKGAEASLEIVPLPAENRGSTATTKFPPAPTGDIKFIRKSHDYPICPQPRRNVTQSVFRAPPASCTDGRKIVIVGLMHSHSNVWETMIYDSQKYDPRGRSDNPKFWKHGLVGESDVPFGLFEPWERILVTVRNPYEYCDRMKRQSYEMSKKDGQIIYKGKQNRQRNAIFFEDCKSLWIEFHMRWYQQALIFPGSIRFVNSFMFQANRTAPCDFISKAFDVSIPNCRIPTRNVSPGRGRQGRGRQGRGQSPPHSTSNLVSPDDPIMQNVVACNVLGQL